MGETTLPYARKASHGEFFLRVARSIYLPVLCCCHRELPQLQQQTVNKVVLRLRVKPILRLWVKSILIESSQSWYCESSQSWDWERVAYDHTYIYSLYIDLVWSFWADFGYLSTYLYFHVWKNTTGKLLNWFLRSRFIESMKNLPHRKVRSLSISKHSLNLTNMLLLIVLILKPLMFICAYI